MRSSIRPRSFGVTWEFGGKVSWLEVRLEPEAAERTRLVLEHVSHVEDELWLQYGPGALTGDLRLRACLTPRGTACGAHNGVTATGSALVATQVGLGESVPVRRPLDARTEAVVPTGARAAWLSSPPM